MLEASYTPRFEKDVRRLRDKGASLDLLAEIVDLVIDDTPESRSTLAIRHRMHRLKGKWSGAFECHVANAGDWLVVWRVVGGYAHFLRTGTHDELFRR